MADCTIEDIFDDAAKLLGDHDGENFTQTVLSPYRLRPYGEIYGLMVQLGLPLPEREVHLIVPAFTTKIQPADEGLVDFSVASEIFERAKGQQLAISSIGGGPPATVETSAAHGLALGTWVTVTGARPTSLNAATFVVPVTDTTFQAPGLPTGVDYAGGGMYVNVSSEEFKQVTDNWPDRAGSQSVGSSLRNFRDTGGAIEFLPCSNDREIRLRYKASSVCPESGSLGINNAREFMSTAVAALAASSNGMPERGRELAQQAYGPSGEADGSGGLLRLLLLPLVHSKNDTRKRPQPFRAKRDHLGALGW